MQKTDMNRKEKSQQIREKIIEVTRRLFIEQGYSATTIRQILKETGLTTGSLYHFFRNKEDILMQIASDYLEDANAMILPLLKDRPDPIVHYALIIALQLKIADNHERIAELYLHSYGSWRVSEIICLNSAKRNKAFFEKFSPGMTDQEWYTRSLAINGIIQNCIAEKLHSGKIAYDERLNVILTAAFGLFNVPQSKVKPAIDKACSLVKNRKISLYGVKL